MTYPQKNDVCAWLIFMLILNEFDLYIIWLVVGPPLWKLLVSWDDDIPKIWENFKMATKPPTRLHFLDKIALPQRIPTETNIGSQDRNGTQPAGQCKSPCSALQRSLGLHTGLQLPRSSFDLPLISLFFWLYPCSSLLWSVHFIVFSSLLYSLLFPILHFSIAFTSINCQVHSLVTVFSPWGRLRWGGTE